MRFRLALFTGLTAAVLFGQTAKQANDRYATPESRSKIAASLTAKDRDARQRPQELVAQLGIRKGMTVADIGTGAGYMLPWLSEAVGPGGRVLAEDIFPDFLATARTNAAALRNVDFIHGSETDVKLPAGSVDLALVLDAYHHFDHPKEVLASLRSALKPGGRVAIVEYHRKPNAMAGGNAMQHIRATREEFVREIESYGFRALEVKDFTPDVQWLGIFQANPK